MSISRLLLSLLLLSSIGASASSCSNSTKTSATKLSGEGESCAQNAECEESLKCIELVCTGTEQKARPSSLGENPRLESTPLLEELPGSSTLKEARRKLHRAVRLLRDHRRRTGSSPLEFGPCPPVFTCCKTYPDGLPEKEEDEVCVPKEYLENGEEWREIGFVHNEPSVLSFFGTFEEGRFRARASADLNCDGEPEFVVERLVPVRTDGTLDLEHAYWEYSPNAAPEGYILPQGRDWVY